jgi:hypothetical protein
MQSPRSFPEGPVPHIFCEDGIEISVQAGKFMHSIPKNDIGPWTHVEIYIEHPILLKTDENNISHYTPIEDLAKEIIMHSKKKLTFFS